MSFDTRKLINSRYGVGLAAFLARNTPPKLGYRLAYLVANFIASRRNWPMARATRANQWVVSGKSLDKAELDAVVRENFRNTARSIFDLNRDIQKPAAIHQLIADNPIVRQLVDRSQYSEEGLVVVGVHLGNFDFVLQAVFLSGASGMVITLPEVEGGYELQYKMRKSTGMNLMPANPETMRQAVKHLRSGGWVMTGLDRPIHNPGYRPNFFGYPSALPVHHVYLASKAQVPLIVGAALRQTDGRYKVLLSEPIRMESGKNHKNDLLLNAEAACRLAESFIRLAPTQWSMSFPVWPEALEEVPG